MPKYLVAFGYESPSEYVRNRRDNNGFRGCELVYVDAATEEEALNWGARIAERFIQELFLDPQRSWIREDGHCWIEQNRTQYDSNLVIPIVSAGAYPDMNRWIRDAGGAETIESVEKACAAAPSARATEERSFRRKRNTVAALGILFVVVSYVIPTVVKYRSDCANEAIWNERVAAIGPGATPQEALQWLLDNGFKTYGVPNANPDWWMGHYHTASGSFRTVYGEKKNDIKPSTDAWRYVSVDFIFNNDFTYRGVEVRPMRLSMMPAALSPPATTSAPASSSE
ncbi:MAG TPA: hypothetical protein P5081_11365 [Phycisphaerae bacterium]|nr:hypothetical protein [Phycisphaerae bacterium]HRW53479.1 hypothetical protein [Phycisphaerae bacterium]